MRTVGENFKKSGKYFKVAMSHLLEAFIMSATCVLACVYNRMNGRFGRRRLKKPYAYAWRVLTWGTLVWVTLVYVAVPFFNWWDRVVYQLNYIIWG